MATSTSAVLSTPSRDQLAGPFADIRYFWGQLVARVLSTYRPELHYMRGPGPAWHAKHQVGSN